MSVLATPIVNWSAMWKVFLVAVPVLLVVLGWAMGLARAILLVAFFAGTVLAARAILQSSGGWVVLVLVPALLVSVLITVRVVRVILAQRRHAS